MIDRVAVLSDVHGVLPALTAVLAEPDVQTAERIVLTGDIVAGPQPVQTLDLLLSLGDRVIWVGGNCERVSACGADVPDGTLTTGPRWVETNRAVGSAGVAPAK